jgi:hypothetical protein
MKMLFHQCPRELGGQFIPLFQHQQRKILLLSAVSASPKCDQQQTLYHPNVNKHFQVMETVDHIYIIKEHNRRAELL